MEPLRGGLDVTPIHEWLLAYPNNRSLGAEKQAHEFLYPIDSNMGAQNHKNEREAGLPYEQPAGSIAMRGVTTFTVP